MKCVTEGEQAQSASDLLRACAHSLRAGGEPQYAAVFFPAMLDNLRAPPSKKSRCLEPLFANTVTVAWHAAWHAGLAHSERASSVGGNRRVPSDRRNLAIREPSFVTHADSGLKER